MNPFTSINIAPGYNPGRIITWTIDPVFKEKLPYNFTLEGSEDPAFKEINVTIPGGDTFFIADITDTIQSFLDSFLYRVKLETGDNNTYYSESIFYDGGKEDRRKYLYAKEATRRELLRARYAAQKKAWLLKRKNYSVEASEELDPVTGVPITDNKNSFGTKFKGGYYDPLGIKFIMEGHDDEMQLSQDGSGVVHRKIVNARMVGFPSVNVHDVIVNTAGERYSVTKTKTRFYPGTGIVIVQLLDMQAIPNTDPVYSIAVY